MLGTPVDVMTCAHRTRAIQPAVWDASLRCGSGDMGWDVGRFAGATICVVFGGRASYVVRLAVSVRGSH